MVIIELGSIYKISHGDLNSGNILVATTDKTKVSYMILVKKLKVDTFGILPIFLDFGRCTLYDKNTKNKYDILQDVLMIFGVFSAWMHADLKAKVRDFVTDQLKTNKRDLLLLIDKIDTIFM